MLSAGIKRAYALFGCVTPTRSRSVGEKRFAKRSLLALYNRSVVALTKEGRQTRMEHTGGKSQAQSIITDQASYEFAVTNTLVKAHAFLFRAEQETGKSGRKMSHLGSFEQLFYNPPEDFSTKVEEMSQSSFKNVRLALKILLTTLKFELPADISDSCDAIIAHEYTLANQNIVDAASLPRIGASQKVAIWRGDITMLAVDGIVNAANEWMLGCFRALHACIDNVIHDKAGPKLRVECKKVIGPKGTLPTGEARITGAYQLPSKYVLHTVGPIIDNPQEGLKPEELAACYTNCLELAKQHKLKSVAFCCISTGVFGYPQEPAAEVALASVRDWLSKPENSEALDLVVFNVFTEKDLDIYSKLAPTVFK